MKKILLSSSLIFSALLAMQTVCWAQTVETVPLYRLRYVYTTTDRGSGNQSEHVYTANKVERDSALKNLKGGGATDGSFFLSFPNFVQWNFIDEGTEGYLSPKEVPGTVPLYRLYKDGGTKHYYTADAKDKRRAMREGYTFENIVGYVSTTQTTGTTPLHLLYRATNGKTRDDHFYTIEEDEKYGAIHKYGYTDQGIACYVWTSAVTLGSPLVRKR